MCLKVWQRRETDPLRIKSTVVADVGKGLEWNAVKGCLDVVEDWERGVVNFGKVVFTWSVVVVWRLLKMGVMRTLLGVEIVWVELLPAVDCRWFESVGRWLEVVLGGSE